MIPSDRWQQYILYASFVISGRYVVIVSRYQTFDTVIEGIRDHVREMRNNPDDLGKLILVSHMTLVEEDADFLVKENLIDLYFEN